MSTSQKVRITSEKETLYIDRGRHRVKKLKTRLRVLGGFVISSKKGKKKRNSIGKKMAAICQGSRADFLC